MAGVGGICGNKTFNKLIASFPGIVGPLALLACYASA